MQKVKVPLIYLNEKIKECELLVEKHSNMKGRVHRDMWYFYMGKLCAYQQLLKKMEE